jgi:TolB-like protein/class 3 adenylate cyclase/Tfp pilus assembly protein PilF
MTTATATRRLAAILAADVVGYSRLMGADEEGTHERFKAHLRELIAPKITENHGRIVKTTGDGLLAEFASVVGAVRCAGEIQRAMADRDLGLAEERRLRFRIGVNLGDVIVDGDDIYGDGVNIAVRLEGLAAPGSVCVSGTVRDHIGDRLPYAFEDMGEQSVKNIARPLRVYAFRPEGLAGVPAASGSSTVSGSRPVAAPRLSIVVLPFTNLSDDREQQYFADGITEDLTTDLSRLENMFVISRNTAFTYRNKPVDTRQIGRELGVRYVLEGSVRRSGNQLRVSAQLIEAATDAHLWAERFDRDTGALFALQNEITSRLANSLGVELIAAEAARPSEHPNALDYILRGRAAWNRGPTRDNYAHAISLFERALARDPRSVDAQTWLASALATRVTSQLTDSAAADIARAEGLIGQVLAASPRSPLAHYAKGQVLRTQDRWEAAIPEYETALALNRNLVGALNGLGWCKLCAGSIDEVIPLQERAVCLSPRDPRIGWWYFLIGTVHLLQSRTDEAIVWFEKAHSSVPAAPIVRSFLASAYALKGAADGAAAELAEARRLSGDDRYLSFVRLKARSFGVPKVRALFEATYFAGLRKAGMPEE